MKEKSKIRTRSRSVLSNVTDLARTVYLENKKMNAAKSTYDGTRKTLYRAMKEGGIAPFRFETVNGNGERVLLETKIEAPPVTSISVDKLRELIKDETTLFKILSATKKDVEDHVGSIVAVQATIVKEGTENVYVKPVS